ncbi:phosphohistidine phosphatase SixA [Chlamydiota bacterium]
MKLYLVRHGESLSTSNGEQVLSEKGIRKTQEIARLLKQASVEIDEIIHSEKERARQTAEIIGQIAAPDLTMICRAGLKPNDPVEPFLDEMVLFDRNVMVVSHLPFLEKLLTTLVCGSQTTCPVDFCDSCVVCLQGSGHSWRISWILSPQLLHP